MNKSTKYDLVKPLLTFLSDSVTPFHAVKNCVDLLKKANFVELKDGQDWSLEIGKQYFVTRNNSSIIAFNHSKKTDGINIIGAHTDSPCLKIKPNADVNKGDYLQLGVEVYGGALLNPWFDRDLSIAGRISAITKGGERFEELIDFEKPIACVPSLAIHLDREANKNRSINAQKHLPLLLACANQDNDNDQTKFLFKDLLKQQSVRQDIQEVLDYELSCYDTQAANVIGLNNEFLTSARLDNLLSTFIGITALIDSDSSQSSLFVSNDHEEVGSSSACGAQGPFLRSVLEQICHYNSNSLTQLIDRSNLISVDNAHALHPNYSDKHEPQHSPILNQGPVIKVNANQRYATNSVSAADFRHLCSKNDVPIQTFVTRSDLGCGSTIGPITATELGIQTIDIGIPQLAMHSIRELAGVNDCKSMLIALTAFLNR